MWPFNRSVSLSDSGILKGFTDWHSHILPGVDDGVETMSEALEILKVCEENGVERIWLTPHIMEDAPNDTKSLKQRFSELNENYTGGIELRLAAENMLDNLFEERLESNDFLPLGQRGDCLLVETSYFTPPMNFQDILEQIKSKGYRPVLAHPERYVYMEKKDYIRLFSSGIILQVNLFSLTGMYGMNEKRKAEWLLAEGMVGLAGSDTHSLDQYSYGINAKRAGSKAVRNLLRTVKAIEP